MFGLRERKRTMAVSRQCSDLAESCSSDGETSDEWSASNKSKTTRLDKKAPKKDNPLKSKSEEKPFISEYEKIRLQNIAERNELLRSMGINVSENLLSAPPKKMRETKKVKKEKENGPVRMSLRLRGKPSETINSSFVDESVSREPQPDFDSRNLGCMRWDEDEMDGREKFLEDLERKVGHIKYDADLNLSSCSQDRFRDGMLSLEVEARHTPRVVGTRIQSLCIHPSATKRIVFAGSIAGSLGIWDADGPEGDNCMELQSNNAPINCITVDDHCPNKTYITSHDGTLTCADIDTKQFINVYATSFEDNINHLTWHHQMDADTFLVAHGNGSVLVVDRRSRSVSARVSCFSRSARTVQLHPSDSKCFLTSSGAHGNGCGIFDVRTKKEVSHLEHSKGTTGAFFSHTALNVVTTCNDNTIKIWDSKHLNKVKLIREFPHNNHTGRWLSVLRAQWYPGRDDILYVGSLLKPRRIQMYTTKGEVLTELRSNDLMVTVQPVLAAHSSLPFLVGGNSSGRLHAFTPPQ